MDQRMQSSNPVTIDGMGWSMEMMMASPGNGSSNAANWLSKSAGGMK
jgi:hypothetical protein